LNTPRTEGDAGGGVTVAVKRLESVLNGLKISPTEVRLIWIDVEGHEKHVLEGALEYLEAGVPVVCEFNPRLIALAGISPKEFSGFLASRFREFCNLDEKQPSIRPSSEIAKLFEAYVGESYTDLLMFNRKIGPVNLAMDGLAEGRRC
jgi:hypothetical protein